MKTNKLILLIIAMFAAFMLSACDDSKDGGKADPGEKGPTLYTVRFKMNGGVRNISGNTSDVVIRGIEPGTTFQELDTDSVPTPFNLDLSKVFVGWNSQVDYRGADYYPATELTPDNETSTNVTLYAVWAEDVSIEMLDKVVCNDPYAIYAITANTTLASADTSKPVTPMCAGTGEAFQGKLYGQGYTVIYSHDTSVTYDYSGLFGRIDGAFVTDLVINSTPTGKIAAGKLAGLAKNSVINNITVLYGVTAGDNNSIVGGVAGIADNTTISGVFSTATATIAKDNVTFGGIAGRMINGSVIQNSIHKAGITISSGTGHTVGGIAGIVDNGSILSSYTNDLISVTSDNSTAGNIAGVVNADGIVKDCLSIGMMLSSKTAGRIAGSITSDDVIQNSYANSQALVNFNVVNDSAMNGSGITLSDIRKSSSFFQNKLHWDLAGAWTMPRHYEYPVLSWQNTDKVVEIASAEELQAIDGTKNYILVADIDLTGLSWGSISSLSGVFDGNGKTISNLTKTDNKTAGGLFSTITGTGAVKNLKIVNASIVPAKNSNGGGESNFGVIAGTSAANSMIENVVVTGSLVDGGRYTGGLVADASGIILNSSFNGTVSGDFTWQGSGSYVGGLAARLQNGSYVLFSSASGNVKFSAYDKTTSVKVFGGGISGYSNRGIIISSYSNATVDIESSTHVIGSLVGQSNGTTQIIGSYTSGDVIAEAALRTGLVTIDSIAGGLVGIVNNSDVIKNSAAFGSKVEVSFTNAASATTKKFTAGKLYGKKNATSNIVNMDNACVSSLMSMVIPADITVPFTETVDDNQKSTVTPVAQTFYSDTLGWNFTNVWKMPTDGGMYPILQWQ